MSGCSTSVSTGIGNLACRRHYVLKLVVVDYGIERNINFCPKAMGVLTETGNIGYRVACRSPCAKPVSTNIYGIGTMVDGSDAAFEVLCRSQKFECSHV